jgi:hypothetical protein
VVRSRRRTDRPEASNGTLEEDEEDEEPTGMQTGTSLDEFAIESDPERFDRTFRSTGADLDIEGRFDPAPGAKQVLPRLAYTINFQMVWNPDRERWEPQKKSDPIGRDEVGTSVAEKTSDQSIPTQSTRQVTWETLTTEQIDGWDLANDRYVVPVDGLYHITASLLFSVPNANNLLSVAVQVNGTDAFTGSSEATEDLNLGSADTARTISLGEGDVVTVNASTGTTGNGSIPESSTRTFCNITRLKEER